MGLLEKAIETRKNKGDGTLDEPGLADDFLDLDIINEETSGENLDADSPVADISDDSLQMLDKDELIPFEEEAVELSGGSGIVEKDDDIFLESDKTPLVSDIDSEPASFVDELPQIVNTDELLDIDDIPSPLIEEPESVQNMADGLADNLKNDIAEIKDEEYVEPSFRLDEENSAVVLEAVRELLKTNSRDDFFNVFLLLIMGQFTSSAVSVITPVDEEDLVGKWIVSETRGVKIKSKAITFRGSDPLMGQILESKDITDIRKYSHITGFSDECKIFESIGGRYLVPFVSKTLTNAVIVLGEKLSGSYSPEEMDFLWSFTVAASQVYARLCEREKLDKENKYYIERNTEYSEIENIERELRKSLAGSDMDKNIGTKMRHYGAESYCFFIRNDRGDSFVPRIFEEEDLMGFVSSKFSLPSDCDLCSHFIQHDDWEDYENPASFQALRSVFSDMIIIKMNLCAVYPYVVRGHLAGFLMILRGNREKVSDSHYHIMRLARTVFSYLHVNSSVSVFEGTFSDIVSRSVMRMERSIAQADNLRIPVSFVTFIIKNLKRYHAVYGREDSEELMSRLSEVILSRISHSDYAVRTEPGKIVVVLPGKTKKYTMPFATTVRNEVVSLFKARESQIMLTFILSEYPLDGKNIYELCDFLE